jgi:hypothetical protein
MIAIGISLLISLPDAPALVPGSLMQYFSPVSLPSQIDNFLSDTIVPFFDPITRFRFDEFSNFILKNLHPEFELNEDDTTRLEIAREKILLFAYLNLSMTEVISIENTKKELSEMFSSPDIVDRLFAGDESGITWEILLEIIKKVNKISPEIFQVIDRLIVHLQENLKEFKEKDMFVTITAPAIVYGNLDPFRIMVFMLNNNKKEFLDKKRPVSVKLVTDQIGSIPDTYGIALDEAECDIKSDSLPFISEEEDLVGVLSRILQVGDAVWFQLIRKTYTSHLFNIRVSEDGIISIFGKSLEIELRRDINYYISQYGGKLSALAGAILPVIGFLFQFGI